ncbi:LacI family transcriptional regulator [Micromonospora sp. DR5-3]|uniref:LacI family DNA-binding transcriptional regulator n=1 Tax=unclassified Micromonospora TaxID=2617518 RepID=UPI0011D71C43|nr:MULTISPECIES: LacI family DNA-binding transcriptional regulator [unclassified Micromonospora]MCW3819670.1 LacI family transcriptional regulator [Micromonospora sp. DR5-3]TYC19871.1 LacI family transcriptional regulator [Micromonospora sp. MP36]
MKVTRADVARRAQTSPAVVSYVINGGPRSVAPATRARVEAAIRDLGYRPNRVAQALRRTRSGFLGLLMPDGGNPFFAELANAIEAEAARRGKLLFLLHSDGGEEGERLAAMGDVRAEGVLWVPHHESPSTASTLANSPCPVVVLDRVPADAAAGYDSIAVDHYQGARLATSHLVEHGYRQVSCLSGPSETIVGRDRTAGWRQALADHGITEGVWDVPADFTPEGGRAAGNKLLDRLTFPAAVFVASDRQALGLLRAVRDRELDVPRDVAIVSFDGTDVSAYITPPLSTMRQPLPALAAGALTLLEERIRDPYRPARYIALPAEPVFRTSCGCGQL